MALQRGRASARFPVSGAYTRVPVGSRADSVIGWGVLVGRSPVRQGLTRLISQMGLSPHWL